LKFFSSTPGLESESLQAAGDMLAGHGGAKQEKTAGAGFYKCG